MSDYQRSYVSPPKESGPFKSDRSAPRTNNLAGNDLTYKDLKQEYSKVLNYVDSIRQDRHLYKQTSDPITDTKGYSGVVSPSTAEKSPYRSTKKTPSASSRYPESEKRIIELEQEVSELKKMLENHKLRISTLQRENQEYQERIKDFKKIDQCNKQLSLEMKTLDHEILTITKQMRELEKENARLIAEKNGTDTSISTKDFQRSLTKYGNYILYLMSTLDTEHFGRFCFEERFFSEQELLKLIDSREKDKLLLQSFRYIADLLLNVSSTAKSTRGSAVLSNKLVDLNETYTSASGIRATTPKGRRGIRFEDSSEARHSYGRNVLTDPDEDFRNSRNSARKNERESQRSTDIVEEIRNKQYYSGKKAEQIRQEYEDQKAKLNLETNSRLADMRKEDQYLDRNIRQSLPGSKQTGYKDVEYISREEKQYSGVEERRSTEPNSRHQYVKLEEQPQIRIDDRQYASVQDRKYVTREEQTPADRSGERQYTSTKEEPQVLRATRQSSRERFPPQEETSQSKSRPRPVNTERQPSLEARKAESLRHSRVEDQNQYNEHQESARRVMTEETMPTYYDEEIASVPPRSHDKSPKYQDHKKTKTGRDTSPSLQNQRNKSSSIENPKSPHQHDAAPKPSSVSQTGSSSSQPTARQGDLTRKSSNNSDNSYSKTTPTNQKSGGSYANRSKSPGTLRFVKTNTSAQSHADQKRSPSPIDTKVQANQNSGKVVLSPSNPKVSQIIYKNSKSLQTTQSPIKTTKGEQVEQIMGNQLQTEERDLIKRENELLQRIRELREKEKELMEKEREITLKSELQSKSPKPADDNNNQAVQKTRDQRQTNFREPPVVVKSPKPVQKKPATGPNGQKKANVSASYREPGEKYGDYLEESTEPREVRPVAIMHEPISPNERQGIAKSPSLKSILKNNENQGGTSPLGNARQPSPFRSEYEGQRNNREYETYNSVQQNDRRNPDTFRSEDQYEDEYVHTEGNHQKRLTFGTNSNFDREFTSSGNYSCISERKETPPPEMRTSPQKRQSREQGTNYSSFKVSFGRTESKYRKSSSPEPKIPSIIDVPKKKRAQQTPQKYDIIKGEFEPRDSVNSPRPLEADVLPADVGRDSTKVVEVTEAAEIQRATEEYEKVLSRTPEKTGKRNEQFKVIYIEHKRETGEQRVQQERR